jgi:predicted CoA-substrate-specific enzyme activase
MTGYFLGIDVGSVSTDLVIMDGNGKIIAKQYLRTQGAPIRTLTEGLKNFQKEFAGIPISGVGTTGSGRQLAGVIVGADIVKNEITAHAVASKKIMPDVHTILEIGGQDSKIIFLKDGVVTDFAMNTVCAAGTGSFLDRQAERLGIPIEHFGEYALRSENSTRIAGRCAVFAESDMIHKQQMGYRTEDIIAGLCEALVRNYLGNLAKGKDIHSPVMFQGGVAANVGIAAAFEKALGTKVTIPPYYDVMGAYGAALLARWNYKKAGLPSRFYGFENAYSTFETRSIECNGCGNRCEIIEVKSNGSIIARWGDRCGRWSNNGAARPASVKEGTAS